MGIGDDPSEYNPKVHGPYDPARFYGTPDMPFSHVKLGEVAQCRRNKSPSTICGLFSRAYWRWSHKYVQPKRAQITPLIHILAGSMLFFFVINYGKYANQRNYKYH